MRSSSGSAGFSSLFLFIAAASLATIIPGYEPPTGSLSTTTALGRLTGLVQAYIFSILAAVYIAAATRTRKRKTQPAPQP